MWKKKMYWKHISRIWHSYYWQNTLLNYANSILPYFILLYLQSILFYTYDTWKSVLQYKNHMPLFSFTFLMILHWPSAIRPTIWESPFRLSNHTYNQNQNNFKFTKMYPETKHCSSSLLLPDLQRTRFLSGHLSF